ncbi:ATP-binding protein [Methylobacterium sp. GXS13]|uniref:ATP-binding protein n=1 Tax=Methylobacterium sp. GXS13 TaxID=1730094 RepID=UPI000AC25AF2|nr:ATP-binding protein [Methylobacterium sp. GXS13]
MPLHIPEIPFANFNPSHNLIAEHIKNKHYVVFSGKNNCGKSLLLKALYECYRTEAGILPVNRFVHGTNLNPTAGAPSDLGEKPNLSYLRESTNVDGIYYDLGQYLRLISDDQRNHIFAVSNYILGSSFEIRKHDPNNSLSDNLVFIDGKRLDQASTGSRLILRIVCDLADKRINRIAIDEPELGLSPETQQKLFKLLSDKSVRKGFFPHLEAVMIATHSHIFLDRNIISNNYRISRVGNTITVENVSSLQQLQDLQFRFIGESLENFWLPSAIVVVEGKTDHEFLSAAIKISFPQHRVLVVEARGDVVSRIRELGLMIGGLARSAYSGRTLVVLDSVHNKSNSEQLAALGVSRENIIIWENNGIEYLYPSEFLAEKFMCSLDEAQRIAISGSDNVEMNGISIRKKDLASEAAAYLTGSTAFPRELCIKLFQRIAGMLEVA